MASWHDALGIYAARVLAAADDVNEEYRMSVLVSDLAATVRTAKKAINTAKDAANRLNGSAGRVVQRIAEVEAMVGELNAAEVELAEALGTNPNGGPPLSDTPASSAPELTIDASIVQVQAANAAPTA